jgi:tryptophan synthase alpha chain
MTRINRLTQKLETLRAQGRRALVPYIMVGDPDLEATERLVHILVASGADAVELGIPFSDPIADGPVNQRAGLRALAQGVGVGTALRLVRRLRERTDVPLLFMTYYNLILQYGLADFCADAARAGLDGLILADLPPDEATDLITAARQSGLATVFLVAPTSTDDRIRAVAAATTGFIYCVSRTGVTGVRDELPEGLHDLLKRIKAQTSTPVCVGFGISRADQVREVAHIADGVIVGSALVKAIEDAPAALDTVGSLLRELKDAMGR